VNITRRKRTAEIDIQQLQKEFIIKVAQGQVKSMVIKSSQEGYVVWMIDRGS
jgi:hypothetical protein